MPAIAIASPVGAEDLPRDGRGQAHAPTFTTVMPTSKVTSRSCGLV